MSIPPLGLEVQVAVLANEVATLRRELDDVRKEMRDRHRAMLDEADMRELARDVVRAETAGTTTARDNLMRLVTFAVSIGTAIFVIRGGR